MTQEQHAGGAGHQSWAADGPSGIAASGGLPDETAGSPLAASSRPGRYEGVEPSSARLLLAGLAAGAAAMYFLDPDRGARRRHVARDRMARMARSAASRLRDRSVDAANRARGRAAELRSRDETPVSNEQLVARVRAELGHHVERVRPIEVVADGGTVTLRGSAAAAELANIVSTVEHVRGVERVDNQLEVGTEESNSL